MKFMLTGRYSGDIRGQLLQNGIELSENDPDMIIVYGGDGSLLGAERDYPGIPKFPIRDIRKAPLCPEHAHEIQFKRLAEGSLKSTELRKLSGTACGKTLYALNDILIHNYERVSALRYSVCIDSENYVSEVVGDGACVSTVHGSTAYYRSITHSIFRTGIGLAFSNSTELTNHLVIPEESEIRIGIKRGPGLLVGDNNPDGILIPEGESAIIRMSSMNAIIYGLDIFMCPECRRLRHSRKYRDCRP